MANINSDANYSAGSYSNNTNFTIDQGAKFTIDQSTIDIRYIRCLTFGEIIFKNTSTTQPIVVALGSTGGSSQLRLEGAGVAKTDSDWIVLGTGNGTAGQTFNVPLAQGVNGSGTQSCPDLGWLFVFGTDTLRDGSAVPRLAMQVDADNYANATTHERCGNVFVHDTTANTVTFKLAVPVGQEVRMPNVIVKTGATFAGSFFSFDGNPNGTFDFNKILWSGKLDFNYQAAKKVTIKNSGFKTSEAKVFNLTSQVEAPEVETLGYYAGGSVSNAYNVSNSAAAGTHKNIWIDNEANLGGFNVINAANTSSPYFEKVAVTCYSAGTGSSSGNNSRGAISSTSPDTAIYDLFNFSNHQPVNITSGASNVIVDNVEYRPACRDDVANQLNSGVIRFAGSIGGAKCTNITMMPLANSYIYNSALTVAAGAKNITISGVVLRSGASGSGNNRINYIVNDNANGSRYNDIIVHGQTRGRTDNLAANSLGCKITNLYFIDEQIDSTQADTIGARCRMEQVYMHGNNPSSTAIASAVDSLSVMMLRDTADGGTVEKTDGKFFLRMSPTDEQTDYYTEIVRTGVIVFNNNNQLYIENSGDIVELESFVHNNVSAISSDATLRGSGTSNFSATVKMRRPDGVYTSYVATTQAAMQAAYTTLASDSLNRVQFKFRIERTATNLTDYLNDIAFNCTLTGDDYPFVLTPVAVKTTVVDSSFNPIQGARVYLKESSGGAVALNALTDSDGRAEATVAYTADKAINGWVRKSSPGATIYKQFALAGTITSNGLELTAIMTEDV